MGIKSTKEEFIKKSKNIFGEKYDYSLVEYKNNRTKVKLICPNHGIFEVTPGNHISQKCGCPTCSNKTSPDKTFLKKVKKIHNNKYNYSLVEYINAYTKVKIICPVHGIFEQTPQAHLRGQGCPKCKKFKPIKSLNEYLNDFIKIHNNKYNYNKTIVTGAEKKSVVTCPIHGDFLITPANHLNGKGCPKCANNIKLTTEQFIADSRKYHNNKYNYSLVQYKNNKEKVKIICPVHGIFEQAPSHHKNGAGCPKCNSSFSKGEKEVVEYVKSIYSGLILESNRDILNGKELDIYLPDLNLAIEYNGIYWHRQHELECPGYHKEKAKQCKEKGIKLINISDKNWTKNKDKVKEKLKDGFKSIL